MGKVLLIFKLFLYYSVVASASDNSELRRLYEQAHTYLQIDLDSAYFFAVRAEQMATESDDKYLMAKSVFMQSYVCRMRGELGKSFVLNLKALELLEDEGHVDAIKARVKLYINTGEILDRHFAYDQAIQYYEKGIEIATQLSLDQELMQLLHNKAISLESSGRLEEALLVIDRLLQLAAGAGDENRELRTLNSKGLILCAKGEYVEAASVFQEIITYPFQADTASFLGKAWHNLGYVYMENGDLSTAAHAYHKALQWRQKEGSSEKYFITYRDLAKTYYKLGLFERADSLVRLAAPYYDQVLDIPENYILFDLQTKIALKLDRSEDALVYFEKYSVENDRFLKTQQDILKVKDQYKMEILAAGFFAELESQRASDRLMMFLFYGVIVFLVVLLFIRIWFVHIKWSIKQAITGINKETVT